MAFYILVIILTISRWYLNYRRAQTEKFKPTQQLKLISVLGSGGHTKEMLKLLPNLPNFTDPSKICPYFLLADTDNHSEEKIQKFYLENHTKNSGSESIDKPDVFKIPRSREVSQSYLSSIKTTIKALLNCKSLVFTINPDLILVNGPGTCLPIVFLSILNAMLKSKKCHIVFVESFCRIKSLSLTGKIIYFLGLADDFYVQWPEIRDRYSGVTYVGRIL